MAEEGQEGVTEAGQDIDETQTDADVKAAPQTIEDLASTLGWKPEDQYKGPAGKWKDAATFILDGQDIGSHLRKEVASLRDKTDRLIRTSAAATDKLLADQAEEINARWEQAIEDGDKAAAAKAVKDMNALEKQRSTNDPEADFGRANPWYGKDDDATAYAVAISQREAAKGKSVEEQLEAAAAGVRKRFPELFDDEPAKPQRKAPVVEQNGTRNASPAKREKGAADLPADVRRAGMEFVAMATAKGRKYTIDDYARTYYAENA